MKKGVIIGAVVALAVIVGVVAVFAGGKDDKTNNATASNQSSSSSFTQYEACTALTEADAKAIMGDTTTTGDNTPATTGEDVKLTNCSYTNNATAVKDIRVITVTVRAPLKHSGADSNKEAFTSQRPSGAQTVDGYGSDAYWDPTTHQFAILKKDNWITVIYGGTNPSNNTLEDAKVVADKVMTNTN